LPANAGSTQVVIDPTQPKRVYALNEQALFRSDDAGQTWQAVGEGLASKGLTALALDPRQPQRLYVATVDGGLYLSEDGATTWQSLITVAAHATPSS
jgi:photosystem II stability/assembly factor-like uncharacterized protein